MMRKCVVVAMILVVLSGCYCRRCWGQVKETPVEVAPAVVVTSTQVNEFKQSVFDGLNKLGANPYEAVCNLLLVHAFGFSKVPTGKETVSVSQESITKMNTLSKSIQAALGYAIINQLNIVAENQAAVQAAIDSATDTIKDEAQRKAFLDKAAILTTKE